MSTLNFRLTLLGDLADVRGQHLGHERQPRGEVPLELDHVVAEVAQRRDHGRLARLQLVLGLLLQAAEEVRDRHAVAIAGGERAKEGRRQLEEVEKGMLRYKVEDGFRRE